jgi:hypothetical protein
MPHLYLRCFVRWGSLFAVASADIASVGRKLRAHFGTLHTACLYVVRNFRSFPRFNLSASEFSSSCTLELPYVRGVRLPSLLLLQPGTANFFDVFKACLPELRSRNIKIGPSEQVCRAQLNIRLTNWHRNCSVQTRRLGYNREHKAAFYSISDPSEVRKLTVC